MRTWALTRWPENTQVDLAEELPRLKVEIKLHREEQEENDEGEFADGPTILSEARRRWKAPFLNCGTHWRAKPLAGLNII